MSVLAQNNLIRIVLCPDQSILSLGISMVPNQEIVIWQQPILPCKVIPNPTTRNIRMQHAISPASVAKFILATIGSASIAHF